MEPEPEIPRHDNAPNLKLVMNPEGKVQDWQDLPEEEVPDMDQVAMVGNPEIAKVLVEGMNNCKGRGKTYPAPAYSKTSPSFAGSFRQVFDSRRGMFEKNVADSRFNTHNTQKSPTPLLVRSKTLPDIPILDEKVSCLKRPAGPTPQPSPVVPKRSSSKQMVALLNDDHRRPLRSFFANS